MRESVGKEQKGKWGRKRKRALCFPFFSPLSYHFDTRSVLYLFHPCFTLESLTHSFFSAHLLPLLLSPFFPLLSSPHRILHALIFLCTWTIAFSLVTMKMATKQLRAGLLSITLPHQVERGRLKEREREREREAKRASEW